MKFPEASDAYGKIAIGPHGVVRHKIGRGREYTDSTSGKTPHEGWPYLDDFERQLEEYGMSVRHDLTPLGRGSSDSSRAIDVVSRPTTRPVAEAGSSDG